jgi:hypothetical protein
MRVFITERDNFLISTENIKLGSITEKLSGSKMGGNTKNENIMGKPILMV